MNLRLPFLRPFFALLLCCCSLSSFGAGEFWKLDAPGEQRELTPEADGSLKATVTFPGSVQVYRERDRHTFRPDPAQFAAAELRLEVRATGNSKPLRAMLFGKDKDGRWFQTIRQTELPSGEWITLSAPLDQRNQHWRGVGHGAGFEAKVVSELLTVGVSAYGDTAERFTLEVRQLDFHGKRRQPELSVIDWELPASGSVFERVSSRFQLSREYFNAFDPDEIAVDFELETPDGKTARYPAFLNREYRRTLHFTREELTPAGSTFWELRFTPAGAGKHRVRLVVRDAKEPQELLTEWREFQAEPSKLRGPVRVSAANARYFEYANGEFFFPVGLNIHTNTDRRSEIGFQFGTLPDRGTADYDDYIAGCAKNGINLIEVWMAAWTMALEHNVTQTDHLGVGYYSLAAAWKLDHVIDTARQSGVYVNLVIENHGRISDRSDPEWSENPINSQVEYAVANGGFLADPVDFFRSPEAYRNNARRARYIAARWGATPNVMALELWSEVDLTQRFWERYGDGTAIDWTARAATELQQQTQLRLPISTHICSNFHNLRNYIRLYESPAVTHLAGDAYRSPDEHFADHLRGYEATMRDVNKPHLITEYGGNPQGCTASQLYADIHAGLWGSLFSRLAGTPMLWWHDFVHFRNGYPHYAGFAKYLDEIDLRSDQLNFFTPQLTAPAGAPRYEAMAISRPGAVYSWLYHRDGMHNYPTPEELKNFPEQTALLVTLPPPGAGFWRVRWYDTLTGEVLHEQRLELKADQAAELTAPPFRLDLGLKLEQLPAGETK